VEVVHGQWSASSRREVEARREKRGRRQGGLRIRQTVTKITAKVIFGLHGKSKVIIINVRISTLFIPLSTSVYSHRGKMTVAIVKYFCKG
jgi:hypothetical protein